MVAENDFVAIFHSIHRVMKAEKLLKLVGLDILLIPVPRQLSSDCGLAIRFTSDLAEAVLAVLRREELLPTELYRRRDKGYDLIPLAAPPKG